jgi:hypothetical protein
MSYKPLKNGKAKWIGHILRRNCILQHVLEGKVEAWIEVTGTWGRRRTKLLDDLKEDTFAKQIASENITSRECDWRTRILHIVDK